MGAAGRAQAVERFAAARIAAEFGRILASPKDNRRPSANAQASSFTDLGSSKGGRT
jgi:hypothetical protein